MKETQAKHLSPKLIKMQQEKTQTQEQTRTKAGLLATIGLLATLAIGCVPVYHVNRPSEKADEIHYLMKDCHGNNMHVSHRQLMNQPGLRRMYEEQTGKTFVP